MLTLDGFVNQGTSHSMTISKMSNKKKVPKTIRMRTNEQVSIYFRETHTKTGIFKYSKLNNEDQNVQKNYTKHFSGSIFRTYSFLNLLDMAHARRQM